MLKAVSFCLGLLLLSGCSAPKPALVLATTTSTADSGLLDYILPSFERTNGVGVKLIAVGTGQAIKLGERGDADVILVHDPQKEEELVVKGYGVNRQRVMYNDFIIVGSKADPAKIQGMKVAVEAFTRIAQTEGTVFLSRGDESGTHAREKQIWRMASIIPVPEKQGYEWVEGSKHRELKGFYKSLGQGMGETLNVANEKRAYTLSDRGTYLAQKRLDLVILVEGDENLINPYSIIAINPEKHPHVKYDLALKLINYLCSYDTQKRISEFGKDKYGQPLFFPDSPEWRARQGTNIGGKLP